MEWISVEDEMPKEGEEVLYYDKGYGQFVGCYQSGYWPEKATGYNECPAMMDATHWKPLDKDPE